MSVAPGFLPAALDFARSSILGYSILTNPRYQVGRHHRLIARKMQEAATEKGRRIILEAPPRHGKSQLCSVDGPAWALGRDPQFKIITASHTAHLAERLSGQVRNKIGDPLHVAIFGERAALRGDTAAKADFALVGGGEAFAVGVGGTPIGRGANLIVIDDPIKDRAAAESQVVRQAIKDWYQASIYTRLEDDGSLLIMHQRWHDDDLVGWLLKEHHEEGWERISLPAIWDEEAADTLGPCPLGRKVGDALWPERYPIPALLKIKAALSTSDPRDWESMYQQRPRPAGGKEIERSWIKVTARAMDDHAWATMTRYILVDPADDAKKKSDWTVFAVIGLHADQNFYLLDMIRDRMDLAGRTRTLFNLHRRWKPRAVGWEKYGKDSDIQHILGEQEREHYRFSITPLGGRNSKNDRIRRMIPHLIAGRWYLPPGLLRTLHDGRSVDLVDVLIEEEMLPFPAGKHDDGIDAMSRIYDMPLSWPGGTGAQSEPRRYRSA